MALSSVLVHTNLNGEVDATESEYQTLLPFGFIIQPDILFTHPILPSPVSRVAHPSFDLTFSPHRSCVNGFKQCIINTFDGCRRYLCKLLYPQANLKQPVQLCQLFDSLKNIDIGRGECMCSFSQ